METLFSFLHDIQTYIKSNKFFLQKKGNFVLILTSFGEKNSPLNTRNHEKISPKMNQFWD